MMMCGMVKMNKGRHLYESQSKYLRASQCRCNEKLGLESK